MSVAHILLCMDEEKRIKNIRNLTNLSVEVSAKITDGIPTLNIIASVVKPDKEHRDFDYCGTIACADLEGLEVEDHITELSTTVLKSLLMFLKDTLELKNVKQVFADACFEALVQSGVEDMKKLEGKIKSRKAKKNDKWKNNPWFKYGDDYNFKEI